MNMSNEYESGDCFLKYSVMFGSIEGRQGDI